MILITKSKLKKGVCYETSHRALGKTVKFVHTENERFFEEQGKVTEVLLSLSGENRIALDEQELYLLSDLLELEVL